MTDGISAVSVQDGGASGNEGERLDVASGSLLIIDQFMLANRQFLIRLDQSSQTNHSGLSEKIERAVVDYGGCIVHLENGTYRLFRDPYQALIVLYPAHSSVASAAPDEDFGWVFERRAEFVPIGRVWVDTRCMVFVDSHQLQNQTLLSEYSALRQSRRDKPARDLLRASGAAVRYGFNRYGDELGVFRLGNEGIIALWPDVTSEGKAPG